MSIVYEGHRLERSVEDVVIDVRLQNSQPENLRMVLKDLRTQKNLTQEKAALRLKVGRSLYGEIERSCEDPRRLGSLINAIRH